MEPLAFINASFCINLPLNRFPKAQAYTVLAINRLILFAGKPQQRQKSALYVVSYVNRQQLTLHYRVVLPPILVNALSTGTASITGYLPDIIVS
jgi:hypothetical protein